MAAEMSVPFLGRVPIDVKFGQLVESQEVGEDVDSDFDDDADADAEGGNNGETTGNENSQEKPVEPDNRPLVDRYMDCWSYPVFEGFTKTLLEKIES